MSQRLPNAGNGKCAGHISNGPHGAAAAEPPMAANAIAAIDVAAAKTCFMVLSSPAKRHVGAHADWQARASPVRETFS
jgi:hypothetical protein